MSSPPESSDARQRMLALLEANHVFPARIPFAILAHNRDAVTAAVRATLEAELGTVIAAEDWVVQESGRGTYVSHRVTVVCTTAEQVVALFEGLFTVDGVVRVL